jgi:hypothetical protein
VHDKKKLTMVAGGLAALVIVLGILVATKKPSNAPLTTAAAPATEAQPAASVPAPAASPAASPATEPAKAAEPAKPAEPAKAESAKPDARPEANVVAPAPKPAQVPPPAPASARTEPAKPAAKPAEPAKAEAAKAEPAKPSAPPATVVFAVQPWGEIFVNGKSRGVTPPMKSLKLEPGKYKIEVRNTTFAPHVESLDLKSRDEVTVRYKFQ